MGYRKKSQRMGQAYLSRRRMQKGQEAPQASGTLEDQIYQQRVEAMGREYLAKRALEKARLEAEAALGQPVVQEDEHSGQLADEVLGPSVDGVDGGPGVHGPEDTPEPGSERGRDTFLPAE